MFSIARSFHWTPAPKKPNRRDLAQIRHDQMRKIRYYQKPL